MQYKPQKQQRRLAAFLNRNKVHDRLWFNTRMYKTTKKYDFFHIVTFMRRRSFMEKVNLKCHAEEIKSKHSHEIRQGIVFSQKISKILVPWQPGVNCILQPKRL